MVVTYCDLDVPRANVFLESRLDNEHATVSRVLDEGASISKVEVINDSVAIDIIKVPVCNRDVEFCLHVKMVSGNPCFTLRSKI